MSEYNQVFQRKCSTHGALNLRMLVRKSYRIMIPKVIHWCWLSGEPLPEKIQECVDSWSKHLPDYVIKCWTTENFDVHSVPYVEEAYKQRKWAFCADYIRAYALYREGGIYLDSDVLVLKSFDDFLHHDFFSAVEYIPDNVECLGIKEKCLNLDGTRKKEIPYVHGIGIQAAIMGSVRRHVYMKTCLDYYEKLHFRMNEGYDNMALLAPNIYALNAEQYGFKYKNEDQRLEEGIMIYKDEVFCVPEFANQRTYAVHLVAHSWFVPTRIQKVYSRLARYVVLKNLFDKLEGNKCTRRFIAWLKRVVWLQKEAWLK